MGVRALAGLVLISILVCGASAKVLNVPDEYTTIQAGIDAASDGDTVLVAPGVYAECISFLGKNITVTGTDPNDSSIVGYTIINGGKKGCVVTFKGTETSKAVLAGFTITGGTGTPEKQTYTSTSLIQYITYYEGGGINCAYGSPTITHNVVVNNTLPPGVGVVTSSGNTTIYTFTSSNGGGIYGGNATITHNVICRNSAEDGGGLYGGGLVADNVIYDNSASYGGGVYAGSSTRLMNNTIVSNDAGFDPEYEGQGGNVYANFYDGYGAVVANNIICNGESGGGLYCYLYSQTGRGFDEVIGNAVRNNDVSGNASTEYVIWDSYAGVTTTGAAADLTGRYGNISADPLFETGSSKKYRLSAESPCVSAGDPDFTPISDWETDIDGDPRVYAFRVDIGADEYVGYVKPIADAGADRHAETPGPITLDASGSYIADPTAGVSYHWTQVEGPSVSLDDPNIAAPTFTPTEEGTYVFQLVVRDSQATSNPDRILILVGNKKPVANAGRDRLCPTQGYIQLDGTGSRDADTLDVLTYAWTQLEGPTVSLSGTSSATPWFVATEPGIYRFRLIVNDGFVDSEPDEVKIEATAFTTSAVTTQVNYRKDDNDNSYYFFVDGSGTTAVYAGSETTSTPSSWSIFRADAKTGEVTKYDSGTIDTKPKVDGDITVWTGGTGSYSSPICTSLYAAGTLAGNTPVRLETATSTVSYGWPAIAGNTIVYLRHTGVNTADANAYAACSYDICGVDVTDFAHPVYFTIVPKAGHGMPYAYDYQEYTQFYYAAYDYVDVSGNTVVWERDGDIWGADISDRSHIRTFPICTAPGRQSDPAVSGHYVVWKDERNDDGDIYAASIADPNNVREFEISVARGEQLYPCVDGALAAWVDGDYYSGNIYVCALSDEYGAVDLNFVRNNENYWYGSGPSLHGTVLTWRASDYHVSTAQLDVSYASAAGPIRNLTAGTRYDSIQYAISAASDGDVIQVPPGVYDERIRVGGKSVTITSMDPADPAVRAATIFKGDGQLVSFVDDETSDCVFTGFTVTGGSVGIYLQMSNPSISLCDVKGNRDVGLKVWGLSRPLVRLCDVTANGAGVEMGMVMVTRASTFGQPTLQNCLIAGNRTYGVYGGDPILANCTVADNGSLGVSGNKPTISDSIVYFNNANGQNVSGKKSLTVVYSDIQGGATGQGNLNLDPSFAQRGSWVNSSGSAVPPTQADPNSIWMCGDYHLASQGWRWSSTPQTWVWDEKTSPCIDAGDPTIPIGDEKACEAGDPLSERAGPNTRIDMGVYGGTSEASLAPKGGATGI